MHFINTDCLHFSFRALCLLVFTGLSVDTWSLEQSGISFGSGISLYPVVYYSVTEDSNAYLQPEGDVENATVTKIRPEIELNLDSGTGQYTFQYWLEQGAYSTNANDNYTDQLAQIEALKAFGRRVEASAELKYELGHDARGAGVDEGVVALEDVFYPDKYRELYSAGSVRLGAEKSLIGFELYASMLDKNYLNNYERGTANREYQEGTVGAISSFYVSPVTDILAEYRRSRVDYQSPEAIAQEKEGHTDTVYIGASWDVSGKTTGTAKAGWTQRSFDAPLLDPTSAFSWEVSLEWSPKPHSLVGLETSRGANESSGPGVFVLTADTTVSWLHSYSAFFATQLELIQRYDTYYDDNVAVRDDLTLSGSGKLIYSPSRSMDISLSCELQNRTSDSPNLEYQRSIWALELVLGI